MIYTTNNFKKSYSRLTDESKASIKEIIDAYNSANQNEKNISLKPWWGDNGNAKMSGISKTLYHLYPDKKQTQHRLFYCYTTDFDSSIREKWNMAEGLVFIDYVLDHDKLNEAALKFEKGTIKSFHKLDMYNDNNTSVEKNKLNYSFSFCLTNEQEKVYNFPQPSLIRGSAGTGKTIISFELFKSWVMYYPEQKFIYVTYTDELINKAKNILTEDGVNFTDNKEKYQVRKHTDILDNLNSNKKIITEVKAREIISEIISKIKQNKKIEEKEIYQDYFIYSYIRGVIKGNTSRKIEEYKFSNTNFLLLKQYLFENLPNFLKPNNKDQIIKYVEDYIKKSNITNQDYFNILRPQINSLLGYEFKGTSSNKINDRLKEIDNVFVKNDNLLKMMNNSLEVFTKYDFIKKEDVIKKLKEDNLKEEDINFIYDVYNEYNNYLKNNNLIDDNDYAKLILNKEIKEEEKFDGLIVDEVQDLTEIQIESLVSIVKKSSKNISFFGDPNQTINPTVYDYGRFNALVYEEKYEINRGVLNSTHRCGPNLLEYINYLADVRAKYKLSTDKLDLKHETSAITKDDTYWASLIEDSNTISFVLEEFIKAEDCLLIVDNINTKEEVIKKIKSLDEVDDDYLDEYVKTVQEVKGLESKNVIIYNLISDNLNIFENLISENNKVATMTFNKLYVSCTRAEDSLLILEERLNESIVKDELFFFNGKQMTEDIKEDEISLYLKTSIDPIKFMKQAINLIEDFNFKKAISKLNISLRNILMQFFEEDLNGIFELIQGNEKYYELINTKDNINDFKKSYDLFLLKEEKNINKEIFNLLLNRRKLLDEVLRLRDICSLRIDYDEYQSTINDNEKQYLFIEKFIMLNDYESAIHIINNLNDAKLKNNLELLTKYIFKYISFEEVITLFKKINLENKELYEKIFKERIKMDTLNKLLEINNRWEKNLNG